MRIEEEHRVWLRNKEWKYRLPVIGTWLLFRDYVINNIQMNRLVDRMETAATKMNNQQTQVRVLSDDMSTMIRKIEEMDRDVHIHHGDISVIASFLTKQAKQMGMLEEKH